MIRIEQATIDHLDSLAILFDQYRVFYEKLSDVKAANEFLRQRIEADESVIFVSFDEANVMTGFTQLYPLFSSTRMKRLWLLNDLFVDVTFRGKGFSMALIERAKEHCRQTDGCGLILETAKSNTIGNKLYPRVGFQLDQDHHFYSWDNLHTMTTQDVKIVSYIPEHQPAFESLNRAWIEKYFWIEPIDVEVLQNPEQKILEAGGEIFLAVLESQAVGVVALKRVDEAIFEFTKMAVDETRQGKGIGEKLAIVAIAKAREKNATKIILYSNTKLVAAINLYRKLGFVEVDLDGPYKRSDIKMELTLS
jgi:GNAT superfamily N-acetyltransferase